jgi:hypothetical protein
LSRSRHLQKVSLYSREILYSLKNNISTTLDEVFAIKSQFVSIFIFVSIKTIDLDNSKSLSRHDEKRHLDLNLSRLSRPPSLRENTLFIDVLYNRLTDFYNPVSVLNNKNCYRGLLRWSGFITRLTIFQLLLVFNFFRRSTSLLNYFHISKTTFHNIQLYS